jgi:dihydroneopterin aldolase
MNDRIFLRDLRIETVIGIYDWERAIRQTVSFDFEFPADIRKAALTDDIADTLDYKSVAKTVIAFVEASHYGLVETLAEEVARLILQEFGLPWVKIVLNKPGAVRGSRDVGVMIERSRIDFGL